MLTSHTFLFTIHVHNEVYDLSADWGRLLLLGLVMRFVIFDSIGFVSSMFSASFKANTVIGK
jgi:hypothetical protein